MAAPAASPLSAKLFISPTGIVAGMVLYSVLAYGIGGANDSFLFLNVVATFAKAAGLYVYFGSALLAYDGRFFVLGTGGVAALIVALLLVPLQSTMAISIEWSMFLAGGGLLGYQLAKGKSGLSVYLIGLSAVLLASLFWVVPQFSLLQSAIETVGNDLIENMKTLGVGLGGEEPIEAMLEELQQMFAFIGRIMPGMLILSFLAQYSVAALIFLTYRDRRSAAPPLVAPFSRWQIPFPVMVLLPVGVSAWFLGSGWPKVVGENLLVMLSVFYCVTGLSLLAYYLDKIKMSRIGRVAIYILMLPTGGLGFFALGLAGVLDSFFDWRRLYKPDEKLEKTVE